MDAVEVLGAILGRKAGSGSGGGGGLLKDILGGAFKQAPAETPPRQPTQTAPQRSSGGGGSLEELLRGAYEKSQNRQQGAVVGQTAGRSVGQPSRHQDTSCNDPSHREYGQSGQSELDNERAVVLIRAMVNAAKSDGQLDKHEQDAILKQLGDVTQDEIQFLKKEFAAPLNVRDFTWSVPLGMEQQVYGLSLMAINLDQNKEAHYLKELAHGLRMTPNVCNQIHAQFNAPEIYR